MNFQTTIFQTPLRVMIINPLIPASQLTITKMLKGVIFGKNQLIDLILLVYANETEPAEELAHELMSCAFPGYNSVKVTSDLPRLSDADVFCFMTNFANPNSFDWENMDSTEQFDNLYLIVKIASNFAKPFTEEEPQTNPKKKPVVPPHKPVKPVIVADGLLVIDIIHIIAPNIPTDMLFCSTSLRSIAKIVLSDYLKVRCWDINHSYVWAANDLVFHAEIEMPFLKGDIISKEARCDWNAISQQKFEELKLEHFNFNASWMKIEFIERMLASSSTNPYGCIFKACEMSKTMHSIWKPRLIEEATAPNISLGVISDGSLGTIRGLPYVLPLIIQKDSWSVDQMFEETSHLRHEIKRINKAAIEHHQKLVPYIRKFLQDNIIKQEFIPRDLDSESDSSSYSPTVASSET
ncbi:malate dehydrogenase, cytoplasmic-like [Helicoverpa zea]|uniref:malate dehydrogenase, cytoplasmic-like n=1 Tax=Helicoverpa zea TaxID=7113 RepID=UPI001F55F68F|nr:malate dehydrogenase, cytoplasmic-like [Helicoverpa zea]